MAAGLYIHIPFCKRKCNYCDFASFSGQEKNIDNYLTALQQEAAQRPAHRCRTLYVGGGTPSLLSCQQLEKLITLIKQYAAPVSSFQESTFEANPESLTPEKIQLLHAAGFNRFSVGLQSFNEDELHTLGRVHTVNDFLRTWQDLRASAITNINVDLIAGLPGQTADSFQQGLHKLLALEPEHISVYGLQIEEGTPFFEQGFVCDQLLMRDLLEYTRARLIKAGYHHYEISNFAKPGYESKHNINYWRYGKYIGWGSAAASFNGRTRKQNIPNLSLYIQHLQQHQPPTAFAETLTGKAREGEKLMVGLRQLDGVTLTPTQHRFFDSEIRKHLQNGLLVQAGKKVKLSDEGLFLANEVFYSFVAPFEDK